MGLGELMELSPWKHLLGDGVQGGQNHWLGLSGGSAFQVAQEMGVCEKQIITMWLGDTLAYKRYLKSKLVDKCQLTRRIQSV